MRRGRNLHLVGNRGARVSNHYGKDAVFHGRSDDGVQWSHGGRKDVVKEAQLQADINGFSQRTGNSPSCG